MSPEERVETLYLAALSRPPKAKEMRRMLRFINETGGGADNKLSQGLADVFWALLNSGEFILNH
jgi:hypothetical protein